MAMVPLFSSSCVNLMAGCIELIWYQCSFVYIGIIFVKAPTLRLDTVARIGWCHNRPRTSFIKQTYRSKYRHSFLLLFF